MQVGDIGYIKYCVGRFRLAKSVCFNLPVRQSPKDYDLTVKIDVTTFGALSRQSYIKA